VVQQKQAAKFLSSTSSNADHFRISFTGTRSENNVMDLKQGVHSIDRCMKEGCLLEKLGRIRPKL